MRTFLTMTAGASLASALIFGALYYYLPAELYVAVMTILANHLETRALLSWLIDVHRLAALAGIGAFILTILALFRGRRR